MSDKQPEMMAVAVKCPGCGIERYRMNGTAFEPWTCERCERIYPPALLKALIDPFDYALKLRTGEVFQFVECQLCGEWLHLETVQSGPHNDSDFRLDRPELPYRFCRGVDVRVADIVWIADAPEGS